jgi:AcrR family transcriptional regulator
MARHSTRDEILRVATERFARFGYKGTSLQDIAAGVGCSKATLLYHFAGKDAILQDLVAPAVRDLAELVARLQTLDDRTVPGAAIDGFVDLVLRYRHEVSLIYDAIPQFQHDPAFESVRPHTDLLRAALTGRSGDPAGVIAAEVLLAGIAGVAIDDERDAARLRPALIAVARRALIPPSDKD